MGSPIFIADAFYFHMARPPRFVAEKLPHLVSQTALDQVRLFTSDEDYLEFLKLMKESSKVNRTTIQAYSLLENQVLLVATPSSGESLSRFMQWIGRRYVPYFNGRYQRSGSLWRARYRAAALDEPSTALTAIQYVEEAPLRAGLVSRPSEYRWSSCQSHCGGRSDAFLLDPPSYWSLGNTPFEREAGWSRRLEQSLSSGEILRMDKGLRSGWALGPPGFAEALQKDAGRRLTPGRRGRPPKSSAAPAPE